MYVQRLREMENFCALQCCHEPKTAIETIKSAKIHNVNIQFSKSLLHILSHCINTTVLLPAWNLSSLRPYDSPPSCYVLERSLPSSSKWGLFSRSILVRSAVWNCNTGGVRWKDTQFFLMLYFNTAWHITLNVS
jgi:hypothetical protein